MESQIKKYRVSFTVDNYNWSRYDALRNPGVDPPRAHQTLRLTPTPLSLSGTSPRALNGDAEPLSNTVLTIKSYLSLLGMGDVGVGTRHRVKGLGIHQVVRARIERPEGVISAGGHGIHLAVEPSTDPSQYTPQGFSPDVTGSPGSRDWLHRGFYFP